MSTLILWSEMISAATCAIRQDSKELVMHGASVRVRALFSYGLKNRKICDIINISKPFPERQEQTKEEVTYGTETIHSITDALFHKER